MESKHKPGIYEKYVKRMLDIVLSLVFIMLFWWVYVIISLLVRVKLGSPVLFRQQRPGKDGKVFDMIKYRTMTDQRDEKGELLPDEMRLTKFGKLLRATSLEGNDTIRQTPKSLINKGFREVSPLYFFKGCNLIFNSLDIVSA